VTASAARLERLKGFLPELPAARRKRYVEALGLSAYDAGVLCASRPVADFFEAVVRVSGRPKEAANWIANDVLGALGDAEIGASIDELPLRPHDLAELIELVVEGRVNHNAGRTVLREMMKGGRRAKELVLELGLQQVGDPAAIEAWCRAALAGREKIAADVKAGNEKAVGALIGPVMQASGGKADPKLVRATLLRLIREGGA
jgi:aspartyl-tRNA(Asn)/glutamyl-tRNA(Gln) amidotransferase subunit B